MQAFICYNRADAATARLFATALVERGVGVWFDEWEVRPGDSIVGGIESGLGTADVFVLFWSQNASRSAWVGNEIRAYLHRRVRMGTLRIVPLMLDETPLPLLVADYKGFIVATDTQLFDVAAQISGSPADRELVRRLQELLLERTEDIDAGMPLLYLVCPKCGSRELTRRTNRDRRGDEYYCVSCNECKWSEATEIF